MIRKIFIAVLLMALFYSCNTDSTAPQEQGAVNDAELIQAIASAADKQSINLEQLPYISQNVLNNDYSESYFDDAKFAPQFGYEVITRREWGMYIGNRWPVYFDLNGRELRNGRDFGEDHDRNECFMLLYPVTFVMPDSSTITGEDGKTICRAIKEWYEANPDSKERPVLQYPVDVTLSDGTTITINNADEMDSLQQDCNNEYRNGHGDHASCFELVYPVTYIMPDGSEITVADKTDLTAIKSWYEANPDSNDRPVLKYPVDVTLSDGSTMTINNADEMDSLKQDCDNEYRGDYGDHASCFKLVYPVTYTMPDNSEITVADSTDWMAIKSWYETNPDSKERPVLKYPVDVTLSDGSTMTINNADELHNLKEGCNDWERRHHRNHGGDGD